MNHVSNPYTSAGPTTVLSTHPLYKWTMSPTRTPALVLPLSCPPILSTNEPCLRPVHQRWSYHCPVHPSSLQMNHVSDPYTSAGPTTVLSTRPLYRWTMSPTRTPALVLPLSCPPVLSTDEPCLRPVHQRWSYHCPVHPSSLQMNHVSDRYTSAGPTTVLSTHPLYRWTMSPTRTPALVLPLSCPPTLSTDEPCLRPVHQRWSYHCPVHPSSLQMNHVSDPYTSAGPTTVLSTRPLYRCTSDLTQLIHCSYYCCDAVTRAWSNPLQMNLGVPVARAAHGMCSVKHYLVIFGGRDSEGRTNDLHIFNTGMCSNSPPLRDATTFTSSTRVCVLSLRPLGMQIFHKKIGLGWTFI